MCLVVMEDDFHEVRLINCPYSQILKLLNASMKARGWYGWMSDIIAVFRNSLPQLVKK